MQRIFENILHKLYALRNNKDGEKRSKYFQETFIVSANSFSFDAFYFLLRRNEKKK